MLRAFPAAAHPVLGRGETEALRLDADGTLWLAGDAGLLRFDERRAAFMVVEDVGGTRIHGFDFAPDGALWLHRLQGLARY